MSPTFQELTGSPQGWLEVCRKTLSTDAAALPGLLAPESPYTQTLLRHGRTAGSHADLNTDEVSDTVELSAARSILSVAQALATPTDPEPLLAPAWAHWDCSGILLPGPARLDIPENSAGPGADRQLRTLLNHLHYRQGGPAVAYSALVALALHKALAPPSRTVRSAVLFDRVGRGDSAHMTVTLLADGPTGLYPDPRKLGFFHGDTEFATTLDTAWQLAPDPLHGRCVLWSIVDDDGPCNRTEQGSLGGAFAVALLELHQRQRWHGAPPLRMGARCAITGGLSKTGHLEKVQGYSRKLQAARRDDLRVIVPKVSEADVEAHEETKGLNIDYAETVTEAHAIARRVDRRLVALLAMALALAVAIGVTATVLISGQAAERQAAERRRVAAQLASRAATVQDADPRLAALLGLAGHQLDPSQSTVGAMMSVLQHNAVVARTIDAHAGAVTALAAEPGGRLLYTAGADRMLRVWDLTTGGRLAEQPDPYGEVKLLVHAPASPLLATVRTDNSVQLRQTTATGTLAEPVLLPWTGYAGLSVIIGCGFDRNDTVLNCIDQSRQILSWDLTTRQPLPTLNLEQAPWADPVRGIAGTGEHPVVVSPPVHLRGQAGAAILIAVRSSDTQRVLRFDLDSHVLHEVLGPADLPGTVTGLAVLPDPAGDVLAVGTGRGLLLWDVANRRQLAYPAAGGGAVENLQVSGSNLVVATERGTTIVRPARTAFGGYGVTATPATGGRVAALASSATGTQVAAGTAGGTVLVFDPANRRLSLPPAAAATAFTFDANGDLLLVPSTPTSREATHIVAIHPVAATTSPMDANGYPVREAIASPAFYGQPGMQLDASDLDTDGGRLAVSGTDRFGSAAVLWPPDRTGQPLRLAFPGGGRTRVDAVHSVRLVPGHDTVVVRHANGSIRILRPDRRTVDVDLDSGQGSTVDVSPDGTVAVAATAPAAVYKTDAQTIDAGQLTFVDLTTGRATTRRVARPTFLAVYSPAGATIAAAGTDNSVSFYDRTGAARGGTLTVRHRITDLAYRPDGTLLAVALESGEVDIFDTRTGTLALPPLQPDGDANAFSLAWSPAGDLLAVGMQRTSTDTGPSLPVGVNLWRVDSALWAAQLCSLAGRDLTPDEWQRYTEGALAYRRVCP